MLGCWKQKCVDGQSLKLTEHDIGKPSGELENAPPWGHSTPLYPLCKGYVAEKIGKMSEVQQQQWLFFSFRIFIHQNFRKREIIIAKEIINFLLAFQAFIKNFVWRENYCIFSFFKLVLP